MYLIHETNINGLKNILSDGYIKSLNLVGIKNINFGNHI